MSTHGPTPLALPQHTATIVIKVIMVRAPAYFPILVQAPIGKACKIALIARKMIMHMKSLVGKLVLKVLRIVMKLGIIAPMTTFRHFYRNGVDRELPVS